VQCECIYSSCSLDHAIRLEKEGWGVLEGDFGVGDVERDELLGEIAGD